MKGKQYWELIFQNIPQEIMVLREAGQVVVPAAVNPDQSYLTGVDFLQGFALTEGN